MLNETCENATLRFEYRTSSVSEIAHQLEASLREDCGPVSDRDVLLSPYVSEYKSELGQGSRA